MSDRTVSERGKMTKFSKEYKAGWNTAKLDEKRSLPEEIRRRVYHHPYNQQSAWVLGYQAYLEGQQP